MKVLKLPKDKLYDYLEILKQWGELWGPVRKGEKYVYAKLDDVRKIALEALRTIIPPKKFFIPPRHPIFKIKDHEYQEIIEDKKRILFGLHPCDIHGLLILDQVYLQRFPDPFYKKRRENTAIIGLSCIPDDKCLAKSTNTHFVEQGFDLAFTDLDDYYIVWVGSSLGDDLVRLALDIFDEQITSDDLNRYIEWRKKRDASYKLCFDLTGMPDIIELSWDSKIWGEFGEKCLSCGACSMACPTCNCYNVRDVISVSGEEIIRERYWDSCVFKEYAMVAGGHNFREARSERIKLWYTHKLQAFADIYGKPACVGCGRCIDTCPVEINVANVIKALKGEEVLV